MVLIRCLLTAYLHHVSIDELIINLTSEELTQLLDPTDQVCQLLLSHMIAMYLVMRPVSCRERRQYTATMYGIRMTSWIDRIEGGLGNLYKPYAAWPMMISELNREKVLEQYTLNENGLHQWGRRFIDGSTTSRPALVANMRNPSRGSRLALSRQFHDSDS